MLHSLGESIKVIVLKSPPVPFLNRVFSKEDESNLTMQMSELKEIRIRLLKGNDYYKILSFEKLDEVIIIYTTCAVHVAQ